MSPRPLDQVNTPVTHGKGVDRLSKQVQDLGPVIPGTLARVSLPRVFLDYLLGDLVLTAPVPPLPYNGLRLGPN